MNKPNKKLIIISAIILTGIFSIIFYNIASNLDFFTNNYVVDNGIVKVVYKNGDTLNFNNKPSTLFTITNTSTIDIEYYIYISLNDINDQEFNNILITLDGKDYNLNELEEFNNKYLIKSEAVKSEFSDSDVITHNLKVTGKAEGTIQIIIEENSANSLATDTIKSLNYENNRYGLSTDSEGNTRYTSENSANYIMYNEELWRIIGVFDIKNENNTLTSERVKIVRNEPLLEESIYSTTSNSYNASTVNATLNQEFYTNLTGKGIISNVELSSGKFVADPSISNSLSIEKNGIKINTIVSIPLISDYLYSPWMNDSIWLLGTSSSTTSKNYAANAGTVELVNVSSNRKIAPSVYLNPNTRFESGDGSIEKPFIIK